MSKMFKQYFEAKSHSATYAKFRPSPPPKLIKEIVQFASEKFSGPLKLAVDVGCGSGQSTEVFAPFFGRVVGIDSSSFIINEARSKCKHLNVEYSQSLAESIPVEDQSVNLVSVCQALHWFDIDKFYKEANRVLCENGVLAVYAYNLPVPVVDGGFEGLCSIVKRYYETVLGDFVMPQSRIAYLENYTGREFTEVGFVEDGKMKRRDGFVTEVEGTVADLTGYISSWSTYQNYAKKMGNEQARYILKRFETDFNSFLRKPILPSQKFKIRYNYFLLLGRKIV